MVRQGIEYLPVPSLALNILYSSANSPDKALWISIIILILQMNKLGITVSYHKPVEQQFILKIINFPKSFHYITTYKESQPQLAYSWLLLVLFFCGWLYNK
jgi:hypothetical protein